ncbi:peptidase T [Lichenibacterium dinghuense]|uniref:peptidase T n=1 Tax=Lichenibacterium dinghuense TaxID=2895977 RepID=UPI001EFF9112|nr:peptidase T [Lichenibacterium sp. 6Y81]
MTDPIAEPLIARFFRYVAVTSQSDADATALPSTPGQLRLAEMLRDELDAAGAADVHLDGNGILTARLPGTVPGAPAIGFVAHLDTVDVGLSPDVRPQRLRFEGEDLLLNAERDVWLRAAEHPELLPYRGEEIVFGDGTSVLGADNKSAVAILMTLADELSRRGAPHGDILLAFVPDEEIGLRGAKALDLARFPAAFAYTIDGGERGEVVHETFNAASAQITIDGVTAHPVSAKGVLVNPILLATELIGAFDALQTPEHTAGREGYWWFNRIGGDQARATLDMSIRDHDAGRFAGRKRAVEEAVEAMRARHPRARFDLAVTDVYANIDDALGGDRTAVELIFRALAERGIAPRVVPMRGGTDGSALSARGLPTPNYFTGGLNFHSRFECLPVAAFADAYRVTEALCRLAAEPSGA